MKDNIYSQTIMKRQLKTDDILFSMKELAEYLHMSYGTIRNMISSATIPFDFYHVGRKVLFRKSVVDEWLEREAKVQCVNSMLK